MYIEQINSPADVKRLTPEQLPSLCGEVRHALLTKLSAHGGHLGPNLGIVEATVALHYVFDSPRDKIVFDVSHQSYAHKMLTGRKDAFLSPQLYSSVSGYSEPCESEHDLFTIGHTSTSVSLACGLAKGRDLLGQKHNVIALIGDGSLSGGEALEGLDFASELGSNLIIVVNDNQMSIAENHGGLYSNLQELRLSKGLCPCNLFRAMGLGYVYVDEGNDVASLIEAFAKVKDTPTPVVVHINTLKGKGFAPAETNKERWHFSAPFDPRAELDALAKATAQAEQPQAPQDYAGITAEHLLAKMKTDPTIVAIASGTPTPTGFPLQRRLRAGKQFVDVGIAEEHAVALASGIATAGGKPVYGVLSTFIQRSYDQVSQDLCINNSPAVMLVHWGSLTSMTDVTHTCFFDIPLLSNIPNLVYLAPTCLEEHLAMLDWALSQRAHPVAIRVPAGKVVHRQGTFDSDYSQLNRYKVESQGEGVAIIALGTYFRLGQEVQALLKDACGTKATLINPRYITGLDTALLDSLHARHSLVVTLEDGILDGGFGEKIARHYGSTPMRTLACGARKQFADRFEPSDFLKANRLTGPQIVEDILAILSSR